MNDDRDLSCDCLDALAAGLRAPVDGARNWSAIEARLGEAPPRRGPWTLVTAGAVAAAAIVALLQWGRGADEPDSHLLERVEVATIESELDRLERAWREVEPRVQERLRRPDAIAGVFRWQFDYLESNLERCRELAAHNRGNPGVLDALLRSTRQKARIAERLLASDREDMPRRDGERR